MEAVGGNSISAMPNSSEPCRGLLDVASLVVEGMQLSDMKALRATCRESRAIADATIGSLGVDNVQLCGTHGSGGRSEAALDVPTVREVADFVRGIVSRGACPQALTLHPVVVVGGGGPGAGERRDGPANENAALTVLAAFSEYPRLSSGLSTIRPQLTNISLHNIPYTAALASAIYSAAPHLASLTITSDLSSQAALATATPGLCRLLTTCACTSLTSLTFSHHLHSFPQPLAHGIAACTSLQHLQLSLGYTCLSDDNTCWSDEDGEQCQQEGDNCELESVERMATTAGALPALRSLDFERRDPCIPVGHGISCLTRLTSLRFNGLELASMADLLADALSPLSNLVRLSLHGHAHVDEGDLRLLAAGCSQLTLLCFESKVQLDLQGGGEQQGSSSRRRGRVPLPATLQQLHLKATVKPCDLLALQLPPGLTQLVADDFRASCDSSASYSVAASGGGSSAVNGGGEAAGQAEQAAGCGGLNHGDALAPALPLSANTQPPSPCPGFDDLLAAVGLLCERGGGGGCNGMTLWHDWEPSPLTWPTAGDGHVRLFAALRPLRLRELFLSGCMLEVGDMLALVEQLPELEEIFLHCQLHPAVVPLLARLPRLRRLDLRLARGRSMHGWSRASTVATCMLPLLLGAPSLKRVHFCPEYWIVSDDEDGEGGRPADECGLMLAAVEEGVRRLQAQLRRLGRDPLMVTVKTFAVL